jgi:iron complex outermembrane receptor protein
MKMITSRKASLFAGISLIACPAAAFAQDAAAQTAAPATSATAPGATPTAEPGPPVTAQQGSAPGEIIVTANKREQKLNDVGITVAVVSGAQLQNRQINSLADLANTVPSLSYTTSANGTPVYTLRGIGFYETSLGSYPTVSTYVDEVPLAFPVLSSHSAYDLERVEVLKGPQGTLFGQNATGGAINYIAAKPSDKFGAGVDLTYGRFNQVIGDAYITGPITDTIQYRAAGRVERMDGWQISNSRPDDRNGKQRNYMGRLQVAFEPRDGMKFLVNANGWKDGGETQAPQYEGLQPQQAFLDPDIANAKFSPQTDRAADWTPGVPRKNNRFWQTSLRGDIDIIDGITLTSITAYTDYRQRQGDEGDGLPAESLDLPQDNGRIKDFSQEVRLSNGAHGRFRWVVGGNYEHSTVDQQVLLVFPDSSAHQTFGQVFGYPIGDGVTYSTDQKFRNYAFFGNAEYDVASTITLKGGVRYTNARDTANICSRDTSGEANSTGGFFYNILLGGAFGPYNGQCFVINNLPTTVNGVAPGSPGEYGGTLQQHNVSWKAGLDWKPRPGILVYVSAARGYKAGSFPTVSASVFSQYLPVKQESVLAYEGGFKATLIDRTLQFNAAGFYYDYSNKQLRSKVDDPTFGILDILQNIPKSTVAGFEIELNATPTRGLSINTAFTYLKATIDKFTGVNAAGLAANFDNTPIPFTPKYQVGTNVDYTFPVSDRLDAFVGGGLSYRSKTYSVVGGEFNPPTATPQGLPIFMIKDYALLDLRAGIKSHDDRWRLEVWGKNITNTYYYTNVVAATDTIGRYTGLPATYGVSVGYKF